MRYIILFGLSLMLSLPSSYGQHVPILPASTAHHLEDHSALSYFSWADEDTQDVQKIVDASFVPLRMHTDTMFNRKRESIWLRIEMTNDTPRPQEFFLSFGNHEFLTLYQCADGSCELKGKSGHLIKPGARMLKKNESFLSLDLLPGQNVRYFIRIESYRLSESRLVVPKIYDYSAFQSISFRQQNSLSDIILLFGLFVGSFFAFLIYPINLFATNKKPYYLYYALHIAVVIFSIVLRSEIDLVLDFFFSYKPTFSFGLYHVCALFSIPFYVLFVSSFLNLEYDKPRLYKFVRIIFWIAVGVILFAGVTGVIFEEYYLSHDVVLVGKVVSMVAGVVCFFALITSDRASKFLAIGTLFLVIGALVTNILRMKHISAFDHVEASALDWNLLYVHLGILLEFIFFSLALGYNQHLTEREKEKALKNWIHQLKENETIQENYKVKLEQDVKEQTNKILKIIKTLEEQERTQMESDFNKKLVDMELKAIRAQMNPHFIFNSMNSIKHLIQKKEDERALDYLSRFSRLLRKSLQNASLQEVTLEEEIDFCTLYLEIESLRFDDEFEFNLKIDPDIDTSFITIPPLLLQPYLENSLWHGLMHKDGDRELNIIVLNKPDHVCEIIIDDNGIGREAAELIKGTRDVKRKSLGMTLTKERLKLTKERNNREITVEIKDKVDSNGRATGTAIHLLIRT